MPNPANSIVAHAATDRVTAKHEYFFKYLQISPSYWLAHRKIALKEKIPRNELPEDFSEVVALYKKVGDVFSRTFESWWSDRGHSLFSKTEKTHKVWLTVDLSKGKQQLMRDYENFLDQLEAKKKSTVKKDLIQFHVNKIRLTSLFQRRYLVTERAFFIENKVKKERLWAIGKSIRIASKWTKHIRLDSKKTATNAPVRDYLSILVSKNLKDALALAENAARGHFPSLQSSESFLKFDYVNIKRVDALQTKLLWQEMLAAKNDKRKYLSLLDPSKTRKKIKKIDAGVDLEEDYEQQVMGKVNAIKSVKPHLTEYEALLESEDRFLTSKASK